MMNKAKPKSNRILLFILPLSKTDWREELTLCPDTSSLTPLLIDYDHQFPIDLLIELGCNSPLSPMDILSGDRLTDIFNDVFFWRAKVGNSITDSQVKSAIGSWLPLISAPAIMLLRTIRLVSAAVNLINPDSYMIIGEHPCFPWFHRIIHRVLFTKGIKPIFSQTKIAKETNLPIAKDWLPGHLSEKASSIIAVSNEPAPLTDETIKALDAFHSEYKTFLSDRPNIVLLMRFRNGTRWYKDRFSGHTLRADHNNEIYMERLARICSEKQWAMTVLSYDGPGEVPENGSRLSDLYPDSVREISSADFPSQLWRQLPGRKEVEEIRFLQALNTSSFLESLVLDGIQIADCLSDYLLEMMMTAHSRFSAIDEIMWAHAVKLLNPAILVGARLEGMPDFLRIASNLSVSTIALRFGMGNELFLGTMAEDPVLDDKLRPDLNITWGKHQANLLLQWGEHVKAIGLGRPRHDVFVHDSKYVDKARIREKIGVGENDRIILVGINCRTRFAEEKRGHGQSIVSPHTLSRCIETLVSLAQRLGNTRVVIKPHNSDNLTLLQNVVTQYGQDITSIAHNADLGFHNVEILAISDVLVINPSSMLAEAINCDVPGVLLATPDVQFFYETDRITSCAEFAILASTVEEMGIMVERLLTDEPFKKTELKRARSGIVDYFGQPDGNAAGRVATAIAEYVV